MGPAGHGSIVTSVILHGAVWPDRATVAALTATIAAAIPGSEVIEAREPIDAPAGAAAAIGDAIRRARGEVILCLEPWIAIAPASLQALAEAARAGLAIETGPDVAGPAWPADPVGDDLLAALAAERAGPGLAPDPRPMPA